MPLLGLRRGNMRRAAASFFQPDSKQNPSPMRAGQTSAFCCIRTASTSSMRGCLVQPCCKTMLPLNSCIARPPGRTGPMPVCIHCVLVTTDRSRRPRSRAQPKINTQSGTVAPSVAPVVAVAGSVANRSAARFVGGKKRAASRLQARAGAAHRSRKGARNENRCANVPTAGAVGTIEQQVFSSRNGSWERRLGGGSQMVQNLARRPPAPTWVQPPVWPHTQGAASCPRRRAIARRRSRRPCAAAASLPRPVLDGPKSGPSAARANMGATTGVAAHPRCGKPRAPGCGLAPSGRGTVSRGLMPTMSKTVPLPGERLPLACSAETLPVPGAPAVAARPVGEAGPPGGRL